MTTQLKVSICDWSKAIFGKKYQVTELDYDLGSVIGYGATVQEALADWEEQCLLRFDEVPNYQMVMSSDYGRTRK